VKVLTEQIVYMVVTAFGTQQRDWHYHPLDIQRYLGYCAPASRYVNEDVKLLKHSMPNTWAYTSIYMDEFVVHAL